MTPSEEQQLRSRIVAILWSDACSRILFAVDGTTITGASYLWAAHYISSKKVGIRVEAQKNGAGATYNQRKNYISLPNANFGLTDFDKMTIVHECTHLWIDATKKKTLGLTNEMCAYIAGATYLEAQGIAGPTNVSIFLAAQIVAKRVLAGEDLSVYPASGDVNNVRYSITLQALYAYLAKDSDFDYGQDGI